MISRVDLRVRLLPAVPPRYRAIVATAAGAGLRWGEAAGLRADALDLDGARLSVIRTVVEVGGHTTFKPFPKSRAGRRTIPLPGWLVPIIRTHLAEWPTDDIGPIFANEVGGPLDAPCSAPASGGPRSCGPVCSAQSRSSAGGSGRRSGPTPRA